MSAIIRAAKRAFPIVLSGSVAWSCAAESDTPVSPCGGQRCIDAGAGRGGAIGSGAGGTLGRGGLSGTGGSGTGGTGVSGAAGAGGGGSSGIGGSGGAIGSGGGADASADGNVGNGGASASGGFGGTSGASGTGGATGGSSGTAGQPPLYSLIVDAPSNGATVRGNVVVRGQARGFLNVEVWDASHQNPPLARVAPANSGAFSTTVDTTRLASGATTWTVRAWDSLPGQTFTREASVPLLLTIDNPGSTDGGSTGNSEFVMGAENKNGSHQDFESAVQCDTNINQITTGWCSTWSGWETNGCNVFSEVSQFYQADAKHAVEFSLTPWPQALSGQSFGACARGDYNAHYTTFARNILAAGMRHVLIRLAYEWDGNWFPWGTGLHETGNVSNQGQGGSALEYAACFRQFDNSIQAVARSASGAVYWRMVMNPIHDTFGTKSSQLQQVFDAAGGRRANGGSIDFMGVDIYDYPTRNNFDVRMRAAIDFAKRNSVPLSVPEWGVGGDSRAQPAVDNAGVAYMQGMYNYLRDPANNIRYASYFNCATSDCAGNHSIIPPNNPQSSAKFTELFGNGKLGCGANARLMIERM